MCDKKFLPRLLPSGVARLWSQGGHRGIWGTEGPSGAHRRSPRGGPGAKPSEVRYIQTVHSCQMLFYAGLLPSLSSISPTPKNSSDLRESHDPTRPGQPTRGYATAPPPAGEESGKKPGKDTPSQNFFYYFTSIEHVGALFKLDLTEETRTQLQEQEAIASSCLISTLLGALAPRLTRRRRFMHLSTLSPLKLKSGYAVGRMPITVCVFWVCKNS